MPRLQVSLANKCQLAFGAAVVLILVAALSVPWMRLQGLVNDSQREIARKLADAWLDDLIQLGGSFRQGSRVVVGDDLDRPLLLTVIREEEFDLYAERDPFLHDALDEFAAWPKNVDVFTVSIDGSGERVYRYARAVREKDLEPARGGFAPDLPPTQVANPLRQLILIEMRAEWAGDQVTLNRIYIVVAGAFAIILAIAVFWFILTRVILSPVRVLRDTAEKVAEGDLQIRADINTGDEFEQLSETFNTMLTNMKISQDKLRDLNKQLDLKLGELAESNLTLYEANRVKGEFLASVSHELRTPLNSIIGFAEVLRDSLAALPPDEANGKRIRYVGNIYQSSRSLLTMIEELLDLAKIEAGRVELHLEPVAVAETGEVLLNLIRPQAEKKKLELRSALATGLPMVRTDPGKLQQIIFNFLANAVKFTPEGGRIELGAAAVGPIEADGGMRVTGVKLWVRDNGPGIPVEKHEVIFDKFRQLDSAHTREHQGAGLGLAICRELAGMLNARIDLDSDVGRGATFSLTIPLALEPRSEPLMPDVSG